MMQTWELVARERIRDSLARYTWSGDSLQLAELALAFCEDGVLEVRGGEPIHGRVGITEFLSGVGRTAPAVATAASTPPVRRIVRHNVANVRFLEITAERALVASYFTVFTEIGLDHYGRYRDAFVPVGDEWLIQHRFVSTDWRAPDSVFSAPSPQ